MDFEQFGSEARLDFSESTKPDAPTDITLYTMKARPRPVNGKLYCHVYWHGNKDGIKNVLLVLPQIAPDTQPLGGQNIYDILQEIDMMIIDGGRYTNYAVFVTARIRDSMQTVVTGINNERVSNWKTYSATQASFDVSIRIGDLRRVSTVFIRVVA